MDNLHYKLVVSSRTYVKCPLFGSTQNNGFEDSFGTVCGLKPSTYSKSTHREPYHISTMSLLA